MFEYQNIVIALHLKFDEGFKNGYILDCGEDKKNSIELYMKDRKLYFVVFNNKGKEYKKVIEMKKIEQQNKRVALIFRIINSKKSKIQIFNFGSLIEDYETSEKIPFDFLPTKISQHFGVDKKINNFGNFCKYEFLVLHDLTKKILKE